MELKKAGQVSKDHGISTRMLRYYEQAGLLQSQRQADYAYRLYDEEAVLRLKQIIILRKLRVPVKQILQILNNADGAQTVELFRQHISQLDKEITALATIKTVLQRFAEELSQKTEVTLKLLDDEGLFSIMDSLSFSDNRIKEVKEEMSMEELSAASKTLSQMQDKDVRIIYVPPMTVAAYCASGENCEGKAGAVINNFVLETGLTKSKPDLRQFGFDCSRGQVNVGESSQAYELWVSIPDDWEVPAPLIKRRFKGGMYAAHVLRAWDFQDWRLLKEWVDASTTYENAWGEPRWSPDETGPGQGFEEQLNYFGQAENGFEMAAMQLDLLFPIRPR